MKRFFKSKTGIDTSSSKYSILLVLIILVMINLISSMAYQRFDLTSEKRYSLSPSTIHLLNKTKNKIFIKVYLEGNLESGFLRLRNATEDLLKEMQSRDPRLTYLFVNPVKNAHTEEEKFKIYQDMNSRGFQPTNLNLKTGDDVKQQVIFPWMEVIIDGKSSPVSILENQIGFAPEEVLNNSIMSLEYKVASTIKRMTQPNETLVTFLQGHHEYSPEQMADFINILKSEDYKIAVTDVRSRVKSKNGDSIGLWIHPETDLLVIAHPEDAFTEVEKYRIDQFVMNGGKILWAIDPMNANIDYLKNAENMFFANGFNLNLDDLWFKYGIRMNHNLIQDAQLSAPIPLIDQRSKETVLMPFLYFPLLTPSQSHPIGKNLDPVYSQFASSMDTIIADGIRHTSLLATSKYGKAIPEPVRVHLSIVKEKPDFKYFKQPNIPAGILVEGKFSSLYKNRIQNEFIQKLKQAGINPKDISPENKMIFLSNAEIIKSDLSSQGQIFPMGYEKYSRQTFANRDFIENCVEYLTDPDNLLDARNKEIKIRLLDPNKIKVEAVKWESINIFVPLLLIITFMIIYTYIRKRMWTHQEE